MPMQLSQELAPQVPSAENSNNRTKTLKPVPLCATTRACGNSSSAMKAASSVPTRWITDCRTCCAYGDRAASNTEP